MKQPTRRTSTMAVALAGLLLVALLLIVADRVYGTYFWGTSNDLACLRASLPT